MTRDPTAAGGLSPGMPESDAFTPPFSLTALSTMRRMIGKRLSESKQNTPHFYLSIDVDLDPLLALRTEWKQAQGLAAPTVNECIVRATALALREVPELNAALDADKIRNYQHVNIGIAVALRGGLVVPVIREADRLSLAAIAEVSRDLADRARANRLTPDDYRGGTFTVSNLGMLGVKEFIAILNPPQAGILALGEASPRAVVRDANIVSATQMTATLSADHRVVDGAVGASFLKSFRLNLEQPNRLIENEIV